MERVLQAKLKSNKAFRDELLGTGETILIEARQDLWWGSRISISMSTTTKPQYHSGQSWLGEILMKLRSHPQSESTSKIQEVSTTAVDPQITHPEVTLPDIDAHLLDVEDRCHQLARTEAQLTRLTLSI